MDGFWEEEFHEEAVVGSVVFGARGIDFGRAGPNLVTRISEIANETQPLVQPFLGEDLVIANVVREYGGNLAETLFGGTTGFVEELVSGITSGIALLVIVPFVAFFFLKEGRHITHGIIELVPNAYFELCFNLLHQINGQIGGYIRGQLLAVSVVATMAIIGNALLAASWAFRRSCQYDSLPGTTDRDLDRIDSRFGHGGRVRYGRQCNPCIPDCSGD